ncbi:aspartate/glutamate racemase family protein [Donghicola tyrosinivorans]|uniref:Allantoin racemase n=1 Tax=Donghicola tyrosinivorans TaxID=1652492 RepID=A0A2T0WWY6_9RHOB|nr:aspartate/glutamate racemase family protein [Donghicola tyrosinivorans]PRY91212.1 allantoin racemase [Donghicola tyrosinivorans]
MRIVYMNPNSTQAMTDSMVAVARAANPNVQIDGWTNIGAPPAIEGPEHGEMALDGLRRMVARAKREGVDALVIGCFDDTGLLELRAQAHCPVIGIGQAGYAAADLLGLRFAVLTTLPVSLPVIEGNIAALGYSPQCLKIMASGLPVLTVEEGSEKTRRHLANGIDALTAEGAQAVVLGCAGMGRLRDDLTARTGAVVIDGVAAAAQLAPALARIKP